MSNAKKATQVAPVAEQLEACTQFIECARKRFEKSDLAEDPSSAGPVGGRGARVAVLCTEAGSAAYTLLTCLRTARRGAAPGPSGVTADHLFPILESEADWCRERVGNRATPSCQCCSPEHLVLEAIQRRLADGEKLLAYFDDVTVICRPERVRTTTKLMRSSPVMHTHLVRRRCESWRSCTRRHRLVYQIGQIGEI